jgi:hypothetical protein
MEHSVSDGAGESRFLTSFGMTIDLLGMKNRQLFRQKG